MMRIPNVPERMKEAPAQALRAVFAGIGQALLVSDKVRRRLKNEQRGDEEHRPPVAQVPVAEPTPTAPATKAPAAQPAADAPAAQPAADAPAAPPAKPPAAKTPAAKTPAAKTPATKPAETSELPIASYDELSIPSLRARLRGLDIEHVRQLLSYEKAHAGRSDVIRIYERRIEKLGETSG